MYEVGTNKKPCHNIVYIIGLYWTPSLVKPNNSWGNLHLYQYDTSCCSPIMIGMNIKPNLTGSIFPDNVTFILKMI